MSIRRAWEINPVNSVIQFKLQWFGISFISGQFSKFYGDLTADTLFTDPEIYLFIQSNAVETPDANWDDKLHSSGVLGDDLHPFIEFSSVSGCRQSSGKVWELTGDLNIMGIRKSITLIVNFSNIKNDKKKITAEFHFFGTISRKDFELKCPGENEISDEIQINARIFLVLKES